MARGERRRGMGSTVANFVSEGVPGLISVPGDPINLQGGPAGSDRVFEGVNAADVLPICVLGTLGAPSGKPDRLLTVR